MLLLSVLFVNTDSFLSGGHQFSWGKKLGLEIRIFESQAEKHDEADPCRTISSSVTLADLFQFEPEVSQQRNTMT